MLRALAVFTFVLGLALPAHAETVTFEALDSVTITADVNHPPGAKVMIVLFHMAGASRGEYRDIAPRLNQLGYATLAVDQRSGNAFNGVANQTAAAVGGSRGYRDAIPDLRAATQWARQQTGIERIGVLGSSYSASLVLVLAGLDPGFTDAVIAFSPGEYFADGHFVRDAVPTIQAPVFMTSARNETRQWRPFEALMQSPVTGFVPEGAGRHGATALVSNSGDEYWQAMGAFLERHLPAR